MGIKLVLLPLNYKQLESGQRTSALTPVQEQIKQKYAGDKAKQQQLIAALYTETQVMCKSLREFPLFEGAFPPFIWSFSFLYLVGERERKREGEE
eukprot:10766067-Prorocentrum_lima.AAC.1